MYTILKNAHNNTPYTNKPIDNNLDHGHPEEMFVIPLIKCGETEGEADTSEPQPGELRRLFAHEIDLPLEGATVPIIPYLSKKTLEQWLHPTAPDITDKIPAPDAALLCSEKEWARTLRRLRQCGLLKHLDLEAIAKDPLTGVPLRAGAFALVKKESKRQKYC